MKKGNEMRILVMGLLMAACIPMMGQSKQVMLETTEGDILLTLYDDTPKHRDNFLRLVEQEFYDSLLFHRIVKNFIIQAGDPTADMRNRGPRWETETMATPLSAK